MFSFLKRAMNVAIHPLGAERAADCARLHAASFAHPWSPVELESLLSAANTVADAAEDAASGRLVGFVLSRVAADEAEILTIAVDPAYRRKSIAGKLLASHLDALTRRGTRSLFLEVHEFNLAARALYRKAGFKDVGRREGYYRQAEGGPGAAVIMKLDML